MKMLHKILLFISTFMFISLQAQIAHTDTAMVSGDSNYIEMSHKQIQEKLWDSLEVFQQNWDNYNLFPYRYTPNYKSSDSLLIILQDSIHHFVLPVYGRLNSPYGWRGRRMHNGWDIKLSRYDTVLAAFDGKVRFAGYNKGGYGRLIIIRHFNGLETYYAHLQKIEVEPNQYIKAGDFIGTGGNSGAPRVGTHLHWEIRWNDHPLDPALAVDLEAKALKTDSLWITKKTVKYRPTSKSKAVYYVKKGDTLSAIAQRYHCSVAHLCALNGIRKNNLLQIGQKIILP